MLDRLHSSTSSRCRRRAVLNDVYVMYAAQKMPGDVLSVPEMLLEPQSIEARIRATPGVEHCAVRTTGALLRRVARVRAAHRGDGLLLHGPSASSRRRDRARARSPTAPSCKRLADRWFGEDGQLASNVSGAHFFFHGDGVAFDEWATTTLYPRLNTASTKHVRVLWTNPTLDASRSRSLSRPTRSGASARFSSSPPRSRTTRARSASRSRRSRASSRPSLLAFWLYTRVMGVTEMPMLNFLSIFVLLGIGADDILVVTDTFRLVSTEEATKDEPCSVRMRESARARGLGDARHVGHVGRVVLRQPRVRAAGAALVRRVHGHRHRHQLHHGDRRVPADPRAARPRAEAAAAEAPRRGEGAQGSPRPRRCAKRAADSAFGGDAATSRS